MPKNKASAIYLYAKCASFPPLAVANMSNQRLGDIDPGKQEVLLMHMVVIFCERVLEIVYQLVQCD
jgi:hypothetical protein